jgi:hypothetical protein
MDEIIKELNDEIDRLLARLAEARIDRDVARRDLCEAYAELSMHDKVSESWQDVAVEMGWDYLIPVEGKD